MVVDSLKPSERGLARGRAVMVFGTLLAAIFWSQTALGGGDPLHPLRAADTSSPRATLRSFLDASNEVYELARRGGRSVEFRSERRAAGKRVERCLDLSQQPPSIRDSVGAEAAILLKEVLDRVELPEEWEIPDAKMVRGGDHSKEITRWTVPDTEITLVKMEDGPRKGEFLFSAETVSRAREFYERAKALPYRAGASQGFYFLYLNEPGWMIPRTLIRSLPDWARRRIYGQAVWQWIGLGMVLLAMLGAMLVIYRMGRRMARVGRRAGVLRYILSLVFFVAAMFVPLVAKQFVAEQLIFSGTALSLIKFSADVVFLLAAIVVLVGAGNRVAAIIVASPRIHPQGIDAQLIRLVCRVVSLGAALVVFLEGGKYLGVPLTTLLAGAGVGGLALALAAQDMLKNFFGSLMIVLDKPFRVGERIVTQGYDGVVEEIGLRSTKLRLLTGHLATIPNERMARSDIENIGRRPHIRRIADLSLRLDTPPDKVERAMEIVGRVLQQHEGMKPDFPPRVFFNGFERDSLNLRVIYWYHPPQYWDFVAFSQRVNLQIMRHFEAEGIRLALPASTAFVAQDGQHPLELKVEGPAAER